MPLHQFRSYLNLIAVRQTDLREFQSKPRETLNTSGFLRFRDNAADYLATPRDEPPIGDDRLNQRACEVIARLVMIAGKWLIHSHCDPGACGNRDPGRWRRIALWRWRLRLRLTLVLRWLRRNV